MNRIICVLTMTATLVPLSQGLAQGFVGDKQAEVNLDAWRCEYCPSPAKQALSLAASYGITDEEVYRFANYSGIDKQSQLFLDGDLKLQDEDGLYFTTQFHNLGLDSPAFESSYGKQGSYQLGLDFQHIPVRKYAGLKTPYNLNQTQLQLPTDWRQSDDARHFSDPSLYRQYATGIDWERLGLDLALNWDQDVSFDSRYQRWHKTGTQEYSSAQLLHATYLPLPVDQMIHDLSASISYQQPLWLLSLTAAFSRFDNDFNSLTYDMPYSPLVSGADMGQLALDPDNSALKLTLQGQYRYAQGAAIKVSYGFAELSQDQALVPYTSNANLLSALPQADLQGKVNTSDLLVQLNHRLAKDWTIRMKYRHLERDNKTQSLLLRPVITDVYVASELWTLPYDFTTESAYATLEYRPMAGHKLSLGYEYQEKNRTLQAVHTSSEEGVSASYSATLTPEWQLKLSGARLERDSSAPDRLEYLGVEENPLMHRFNVAQRQQDKAKLQLFYTPLEHFSATVSGQYSRQDYAASELGLTDNELQNVNLDVNWHPNEVFDISLFLQQEDINTHLAGSDSFSGPKWQVHNQDRVDSYGGSLALRELLDSKLSIFITLDRADANTYIAVRQAGNVDTLPTISSRWNRGELKIVYRYSQHTELSIRYQYQEFNSADFAIDGAALGSLPNLLTSGALSNNYDVSYGVVSIGYTF